MHGQLGLAQRYNISETKIKPTKITLLTNIIYISAAAGSSLALTIEGKVYAFGLNDRNQLGFINQRKILIPTLIPNLPNIKGILAREAESILLAENVDLYKTSKMDNEYIKCISNINNSCQ